MRQHWIDNLRWVTVLLVVFYHIFYIFNSVGVFGGLPPFSEHQPQDVVLYILAPWFMVLLFIVAGICSRLSLQKRSAREYFRSRTLKLLVPSTIGLLAFHWISGYINASAGGALDTLSKLPGAIKWLIFSVSGSGPLWFIQDLWLFTAILLIIRKIDRKDAIYRLCCKIPAWVFIFLGFFLLWGASFILHPKGESGNLLSLYRPVFYLVSYLMGYYIFSNEKIQDHLAANWWLTVVGAVGLCVLYVSQGFGEPYAPTHLRLFSYNAFMWFAVLAMIGTFKRWANKTSAFAGYMTRSSFGIYILHYTVLVVTAWALRSYTQLGALPCYTILLLAEVTLTPALYELIRRIPLLRWCVLGIRKRA